MNTFLVLFKKVVKGAAIASAILKFLSTNN